MKVGHLAVLVLALALAFAAGFLIARPHLKPGASIQEIALAQQAGDKILPPGWFRMFPDGTVLRNLRDRGYAYCDKSGSIDMECARKQDEAVQSVFFAITISDAQRKMVDQRRLSLREREVARDPELRSKVIRYCERLYVDHGGQDARLLAVCLGNLSEFSPLVPIPVP
jgi:hypothetical protein